MFTANNRYSAFLTHLIASLLIFLVLAGIIAFIWYPDAFLKLGGVRGIKIVAGVDIVLGPILTLMVYRPGKKGLMFDLSLIFLTQFICLAIGVKIIYDERPIFQVLSDDNLYILTKKDFGSADIETNVVDKISGERPKIVFLDLPEDPTARIGLDVINDFFEATPLQLRTDLYLNISEVSQDKLTKRLENFEFDTQLNCYWLSVKSWHYTGKGCFDTKKGLVELEKSGAI